MTHEYVDYKHSRWMLLQIYYFVCVKYLLIFDEKSTTSKFLSYVLLLNITKAKVHDSFFLTILNE